MFIHLVKPSFSRFTISSPVINRPDDIAADDFDFPAANKYLVQAGQAKRRKNDGPLYLEAVDLTLRETSHPGSVPSSEPPKKITATKELVLPENQLVEKKAMALQA